MRQTPIWRRYLRFFGADPKADVGEELHFHLESRIRELEAQGWTHEMALREAYRQFGDVTDVRRTCESMALKKDKRMKLSESLAALYQDVKYGVLQARTAAGTTLLSLIALGIGLGVVTAVFSIVYAVILRPLPFAAPDELVSVWSVRKGIDDVVIPRNFDAWKRETHSFQAIGAVQPVTFTLSDAGQSTQIPGGFASADYFHVFGVAPELGRTFTAEEDQYPRQHLAILSHRLWAERFGSDRGILGRRIQFNREAFTVIGVMPSSFSIRPGSEEAWAPLALSGNEMNWSGGMFNVVGRLRRDINIAQSQAEMNLMARRLAALYPGMNHDRGIRVADYASDLVGDSRSRLFVLLGAVGFVLLIACANVANLLLAKGAGRKQELAVRAAMGATRLRIVRQLLTESALVGLVGAALGLGFAAILMVSVSKLNLESIPRLEQARVNAPVFFFALTLGLVSTLMAGLLPALRAAQVDIQTTLRQGGRSGPGLARDAARSVYIAGEVALALVLLIGAGLLIRTAVSTQRIPLGFSAANVISGRTALPDNSYRGATAVAGAYERILQNLRSQPGVLSAALSSKVPLSVSTVGLALKQSSVDGFLGQDLAAELHYISDGYLATMKIPLIKGREFTVHDGMSSAQVILVSKGLARHLWPHGEGVGQMIRIPELQGRGEGWQVAGVADDVRANGSMSAPPLVVYIPTTQVSTNAWHWIEQSLFLVVRTRAGNISEPGLLRKVISHVDPELPLGDVRTMDQRIAYSVMTARFYALLLAILGTCGLLLTLAGIYGVVAYFVNRQRAEIGVRLALGSSKAGVLLLILRQGMRPVLLGIAIGLGGAPLITRLLANQVYGVTTSDPVTLLGVSLLLLLVALLACYLPARQAASVDPMVALRNE